MGYIAIALSRVLPVFRRFSSELLYKPHFNYKEICDNIEKYRLNELDRKTGYDPTIIVDLYNNYYDLINKLNFARRDRKLQSVLIGKEKDIEKRTEMINESTNSKDIIIQLENQLDDVQNRLTMACMRLANITQPDVPVGDYNKCIEVFHTELPQILNPLSHVDINKQLNFFDFSIGSNIATSHFVTFKNFGVKLEQALIHYALDFYSSNGYELYSPPELVNNSLISGCGFNPRCTSTQIYSVENTNLSLIGTSEISLVSQFYNNNLLKLPNKLCGISHCFRTEAGARTIEMDGIYRVHQFSKVELVHITEPDNCRIIFDEMIQLQKRFLDTLNLSYRVLLMSSEELGSSASLKYDIETFMPGLNRYGEVCSSSMCTDYQSRRLNIRYLKGNKLIHPYTINGTGLAVPRVMISLIETHQTTDGYIKIPPPLTPYLNGIKEIKYSK